MPFQTDIDDKGYQQTVFDPNYWQQEAQKYAAAVATGNVQTHKPAVPPPPIISSMTETPAGMYLCISVMSVVEFFIVIDEIQ